MHNDGRLPVSRRLVDFHLRLAEAQQRRQCRQAAGVHQVTARVQHMHVDVQCPHLMAGAAAAAPRPAASSNQLAESAGLQAPWRIRVTCAQPGAAAAQEQQQPHLAPRQHAQRFEVERSAAAQAALHQAPQLHGFLARPAAAAAAAGRGAHAGGGRAAGGAELHVNAARGVGSERASEAGAAIGESETEREVQHMLALRCIASTSAAACCVAGRRLLDARDSAAHTRSSCGCVPAQHAPCPPPHRMLPSRERSAKGAVSAADTAAIAVLPPSCTVAERSSSAN